MKFVGLVGSNATHSYNRLLLQFIEKRFGDAFEFELLEIVDVPLFGQNKSLSDYPIIQELHDKISAADGVIIATPEYNHTIPSCLKSTIEWLSYELHPFKEKPVMIIGASQHNQGSSRAQVHLRQILNAPGVNAWILPSNEFLLHHANQSFDENGQLRDEDTVAFLSTCLQNFIRYVSIVGSMHQSNESTLFEEVAPSLDQSKTNGLSYHVKRLFSALLQKIRHNHAKVAEMTDAITGASETYEDDPIAIAREKARSTRSK